MSTKAVIGLGFGDEGKGRVVSYLCHNSIQENNKKPLVTRFCGGHQAGHKVVTKSATTHVFSNFGSGTLQDCPTYWSKYCTVDPIGIYNELEVLISKNIKPKLYIDAKCPVTTPYEKTFNKIIDGYTQHGTCGVGFGQTLQREEDFYSILFEDLYYPSILRMKVDLLKKYYDVHPNENEVNTFFEICELIKKYVIKNTKMPYNSDIIFEGSQGLLLDQHYGLFPHVTRSNTGITNIIDMYGNVSELYLVTRAYQTRHGNGPMTNENLNIEIPHNPVEENFNDGFQGKFRKTILDIDLLRYALTKDPQIKNHPNKYLVITCLDVIKDRYYLTVDGNIRKFNHEYDFINAIKNFLNFDKVLISRSPIIEKMEEF